jgi:pimeloyl-ACP methyl ester carboxylesterase
MVSTKFFEHLNGFIAYDDVGEGPLAIAAPSLGDLRAEYRFLVPELVQSGYRVVSMDLRGHGESSTAWPDFSVAAIGADMIALIRRLNAGPALIIGTSISAGAAAWAASEAPDLVSGLVLIGPFIRDTMPIWQTKLLFTPLFSGLWGPAAWIKYFKTLYPSNPPADFDQYLSTLRQNLSQPGRLAALRGMITASKNALEERLDQVSAPVLVIMGTRDPDFNDPAAEARLVAERLGGEAHLIEGAGHYPHAEMPDQTSLLITSFAHKVTQKLSVVA